jgi:hypothetical protein
VGTFYNSPEPQTVNTYFMTAGWTTIAREITQAGNGTLEFFYNRNTGQEATAAFNPNGVAQTYCVATMSPGWTAAVPIVETNSQGTGFSSAVLFYNAATGVAVTSAFNGACLKDQRTTQLNRGWTSVTELDLRCPPTGCGGFTHNGVVFYNRATGAAATVRVNLSGNIIQLGSQALSPGWAIAAPDSIQGTPGIAFYNPASGLFAVTRWNGQQLSDTKVSAISPGWTSISSLENLSDLMIFYNSASGLTALAQIDGNTGALQTLASYSISPGWSIISQLPEANSVYWELFYN